MLFERGVYKKILLEGSLTFNRGVGNVSEKRGGFDKIGMRKKERVMTLIETKILWDT